MNGNQRLPKKASSKGTPQHDPPPGPCVEIESVPKGGAKKTSCWLASRTTFNLRGRKKKPPLLKGGREYQSALRQNCRPTPAAAVFKRLNPQKLKPLFLVKTCSSKWEKELSPGGSIGGRKELNLNNKREGERLSILFRERYPKYDYKWKANGKLRHTDE